MEDFCEQVDQLKSKCVVMYASFFFFFCQFAKQVGLMIVMIYFVSALWIGFSNHSNIYTSITVAKVIAKVTNCKQEHQHAQFVADLRALFKNWKIFENAFLITFSNLQFSSKFFASKYEFLTCYLVAKKKPLKDVRQVFIALKVFLSHSVNRIELLRILHITKRWKESTLT